MRSTRVRDTQRMKQRTRHEFSLLYFTLILSLSHSLSLSISPCVCKAEEKRERCMFSITPQYTLSEAKDRVEELKIGGEATVLRV